MVSLSVGTYFIHAVFTLDPHVTSATYHYSLNYCGNPRFRVKPNQLSNDITNKMSGDQESLHA